MIIGEIRRYLRDYNAIRVSRSVRDLAYKAIAARERLSNEKQSEVTNEEIAKVLGVDKKDIDTALDAISDPISLFDPVYHDGADAVFVMDQISDEKNTDANWTDSIALSEAIKKLGERERRIVKLRFFEGKTQMEVADEVGISQAQVSRLEKSAIDSMKKNI
mgnify:FL=1